MFVFAFMQATRFLVGTEQGVLMSLERKAKKDKDSQKQVKAVYGANGGKHFGPVYSVQVNICSFLPLCEVNVE